VQALRTIYRYWAAILFVAVLVQIGAAGYGAFYVASRLDEKGDKPLGHKGFEHGWDFHSGFGYMIFLGAVVLFVLALAARLGRRRVLLSLAAVGLMVVQILLAWGGSAHAVIGIFHPLNALLVLGLIGFIAHDAWRKVRAIG
jgi:hypothetical protein